MSDSKHLKQLKSQGKFLALILRHSPESIGIKLTSDGWVSTEDIANNSTLTVADIHLIAVNDSKGRYEISPDGRYVRAVQGHSIPVDLKLESSVPPLELYHGTKTEYLNSIHRTGLNRGLRNYIHLSADIATATIVGNRRKGDTVILCIHTDKAIEKGHKFYMAKNGVWLADFIPADCISVLPT